MEITRSLLALALGLGVLIILLMKTKFHPSLALVAGACVVGVVSGVALDQIPGLITSGFGGTLSSIGLVIAFGCMMGQIMEESNAAKRMAHSFIKLFHGKNEDVALACTGFLVSIPIFADSALIILSPLIKSISQAKKRSLTGLAIITACCLEITHCSVPPTPGPLAVVAQFGDRINLGHFILFGIAMGIPIMLVVTVIGRIVGNKWYKIVDENGEIIDVEGELAKQYAIESAKPMIPKLDKNEEYPSTFISFAPIFVPVILILLDTVTGMLFPDQTSGIFALIGFLGNPVIAVGIALIVAIYGLAGKKSKKDVQDCLERGVMNCGTVILITGAGGAFGNIIKSSGIGDVIATSLTGLNLPVLLLPFLMAGILKLVLGSGTVAMTTTATICAPILLNMPDVNPLFAAYAACIGSQMFSLQNDSFFWVLTRTFKLDDIKVQMGGFEVVQFTFAWSGFILLCIVNMIF